jgi:AraC-like DNA-binding protein
MMVERARIVRRELFGGLPPSQLLRATYVTHRFAPHAHEELAIGVVEAGTLRTRIGSPTIVAPAGSLIAVNPGVIHTGEPVDRAGYRYRMLYLGREVLEHLTERFLEGSSSAARMLQSRIEDSRLAARLARVHASYETEEDRFTSESLLVDVIGELFARHAEAPRATTEDATNGRVVRIVREYLEDQCTRVVTLAELAALTGLSPFYVSRTFRAAVGVPPYAYLSLARVRRARALIDRGHPPSAVTHEAGFSDQSHFTKQFKRVVGIPPGQYAREIAVGTPERRPGLRVGSTLMRRAEPIARWPSAERASA